MRFLRWLQLSLRVLLPAIFLAMSPLGLRAQTDGQTISKIRPAWSDAVARLASRIGNLAGTQKVISLSVKNISSLTDEDVTGISQALKAELARLGYGLNEESSADTDVVVTLSEGEEGYMWVGEVRRPDAEQTEIVSVNKTSELAPAETNIAVVLDRKLVWRQPSKFLDFAVTRQSGVYSRLIILEPTHLSFYTSTDLGDWQRWQSVEIPALTPKSRDTIGIIDTKAGIVFVGPASSSAASGSLCAVGFDHPEKIQCSKSYSAANTPVHDFSVIDQSASVLFGGLCGDKSIVVATGNGDWTQPDTIQGYLRSDLTAAAVPSGSAISFDGPVIALQTEVDEDDVRAIVHNLKTGNYEGYVVTATCGH